MSPADASLPMISAPDPAYARTAHAPRSLTERRGGSPVFWRAKRIFDMAGICVLSPMIGVIALFLLCANPFLNRGPLFYSQMRMGLGCRPFRVWKFRTMLPADRIARRHDDPVEADRITPLGRFLRRTRIDELPQCWNVLRGEMSLIGPRPDFYDHAVIFADTVPGYRARHVIRPGISGLAQIRMGYAEGPEQTRAKTRSDLAYIRQAGWRLEAHVFWRTLKVMATGFGAR